MVYNMETMYFGYSNTRKKPCHVSLFDTLMLIIVRLYIGAWVQ